MRAKKYSVAKRYCHAIAWITIRHYPEDEMTQSYLSAAEWEKQFHAYMDAMYLPSRPVRCMYLTILLSASSRAELMKLFQRVPTHLLLMVVDRVGLADLWERMPRKSIGASGEYFSLVLRVAEYHRAVGARDMQAPDAEGYYFRKMARLGNRWDKYDEKKEVYVEGVECLYVHYGPGTVPKWTAANACTMNGMPCKAVYYVDGDSTRVRWCAIRFSSDQYRVNQPFVYLAEEATKQSRHSKYEGASVFVEALSYTNMSNAPGAFIVFPCDIPLDEGDFTVDASSARKPSVSPRSFRQITKPAMRRLHECAMEQLTNALRIECMAS